jgi:putative hydrolase of the HAD superfamily
MPACLLFDLFGTLVDYTADRRKVEYPATHRYCADLGLALTPQQFLDEWDSAFAMCEAVGRETHQEFLMSDVADRFADRIGGELSHEQKNRLIDHFMKEWGSPIRPVAGVGGMLERLGQHYRLGLISNTHHGVFVREMLCAYDLEKHFEVIILSAEFGRPKPSPEIFAHALTQMNAAPEEAVYIGDSFEHDYAGATSAGLTCYLIGNHARVPARRQLRSILDLAIHFRTEKIR